MKLVLFDIDGTLLTSIGAGRNAVLESMEAICGQAISIDGVEFAGRTDPAILQDILEVNDLWTLNGQDLLQECLRAYADVLKERLHPEGVRVFPGVRGLVDTLAGAPDVVLGLLTGNMQETAFMKLEAAGLHRYFSFGAFGSDHPMRNELPPIAMERALISSGHSFTPDRTFVIGDTPYDFECGRAHGTHCIGVSTGIFSRDELAVHGPDLLVADFADPTELLDYLSISSNASTSA